MSDPLVGYLIGSDIEIMIGLVFLQCVLGLKQPIYSSISFSLILEISKEDELVEANGLLDTCPALVALAASSHPHAEYPASMRKGSPPVHQNRKIPLPSLGVS